MAISTDSSCRTASLCVLRLILRVMLQHRITILWTLPRPDARFKPAVVFSLLLTCGQWDSKVTSRLDRVRSLEKKNGETCSDKMDAFAYLQLVTNHLISGYGIESIFSCGVWDILSKKVVQFITLLFWFMYGEAAVLNRSTHISFRLFSGIPVMRFGFSQ